MNNVAEKDGFQSHITDHPSCPAQQVSGGYVGASNAR